MAIRNGTQVLMKTFTISSNELLSRTEAKLEVWECFVANICLYLGFTLLALIALKISSRRV